MTEHSLLLKDVSCLPGAQAFESVDGTFIEEDGVTMACEFAHSQNL